MLRKLLYLCNVLKVGGAPTFADSSRRHVQTPGTNTCRLRNFSKTNAGKLPGMACEQYNTAADWQE